MEAIKTFLESIFTSPHYSYGWLVLAVLAILPAIVSGNIIQHDLCKLFNRKASLIQSAKPLLFNVTNRLRLLFIYLDINLGFLNYFKNS